jgi:hypothetical protein
MSAGRGSRRRGSCGTGSAAAGSPGPARHKVSLSIYLFNLKRRFLNVGEREKDCFRTEYRRGNETYPEKNILIRKNVYLKAVNFVTKK